MMITSESMASIPSLASSPPNSTIGAALLGTFFSLILYGILVHQAYRYYRMYSDDPLWLKVLVFVVVCLESIHTALCIRANYYTFIIKYSDPSILNNDESSYVLPALTGTIVICTQGFFARRAFIIGRQYQKWAIIAVILLLGEFGFTLASTINSFVSSQSFTSVPDPWIVAVSAVLAAIADIILTVILTLALYKSRTGIRSTDSLMDILILYSITTGLLTSTLMLALLITAVALPKAYVYVALSFVSTKLYTNTLLAALNTRQSLRDVAMNPSGTGLHADGWGEH